MAKAKIEVGDKWARLECTGEDVDSIQETMGECTLEDRHGNPIMIHRRVLVLRCRCGKEVRVLEQDFVGKKAMKDCGCGTSFDDGINCILSISIPYGLRAKIQQRVRNGEGSISAVFCRALEAGLDYIEIQEALNEGEDKG